MQLPLPQPQQHKVTVGPLHSQQLAWQEELQTGQLTVEVIRLCKKVETARWEALTRGKELQIGLLIGRLDSGLLEGQILWSLVEIFQEGLSWPSNKCHHQYNSSSRAKHHQLPQHRCKGCQEANCQQKPRGHLDHQEGCQEGNHCQDHQLDHLGANRKQQHRNKWGKRPRGPVKP
jgi:hypothetical protein